MNNDRKIVFIGPHDPLSFTYYHKKGFVVQNNYRFYSLEHWFSFIRAKCFGEDNIAMQLAFTKEKSILQNLKNKLETITKNSADKESAVFWAKNRSEYMNEAIIILIHSSQEVQNFLKEHENDLFAVLTPNTYWGIGLSKADVQKRIAVGETQNEIYNSVVFQKTEDGVRKSAKNKMGTLWMDVRDSWFEKGLDKIPFKPPTRPLPKVEEKKEDLKVENRFNFLLLDDLEEEPLEHSEEEELSE